MTLPAIALAVLAATGSTNVRAVRYHRDARGAAFMAELAVPDFTAGYDRLTALPKDDKTFLLFAAFDDGRERDQPSVEQLEAMAAGANEELVALEAEIAAFTKALKAAKVAKAKTFKAKARYGERTFKVSEANTYRDDLEASRMDVAQRATQAEKAVEDAKRSTKEGATAFVFGRFKDSGDAQVEVFRGPARGPGQQRSVAILSLKLPAAEVKDTEVLEGWARTQAAALALGSLRSTGGSAFQQYAALRSNDIYGEGGDASEFRRGRRNQHEPVLYSVMTGLSAVQEALQVDSIQRRVEPRPGPGVKLSKLEGPYIASHDYDKLRKGVEPKVYEAAQAVPVDAFALHFTSANAVFQVVDLMDDWGTDAAHALEGFARDRGTKDRLFSQLALPRDELTRMYASKAIEAVTIAAHDPFLREGTDLTVILTAKNLSLVRRAAEGARDLAKAARKDVRESSEKYQGVELVTLQSPDRALSTTYAEAGTFAFIGNSPAGVKAALDAAAGRKPSLAKSADFRYMRTLFAPGEDAFAFMSDAFVRGVVGPRWKIAARRRLACSAQLQMIEYGRLLAKRDRLNAPTLEDLSTRGYVPKQMTCAHGGRYSFDDKGAICSVHGRLSFLTPLIELPFDEATPTEAEEYVEFTQDYKRYWRQYVDPVGVRVSLGPPVDVETIILPLVDNSIYTALKQMYAGAPANLARQGDTGKTIAALSTTLSPSPEVQKAIREFMRDARVGGPDPWRWLGDQATLAIYDGDPFLTVDGSVGAGMFGARLDPVGAAVATGLLSSLTLPTALVVKVKDPEAARAAFERLSDSLELSAAEHSGGREQTEVAGYRLTDSNGGDRVGVLSLTFFGVNLRVYYTVVGDQLYIATRRWLVDEIVARGSALPKDRPEAEPGHLRLRIEHGKMKSALTAVQAGWGESMREACFRNLADLTMVSEAVRSPDLVGAVKGALAYTPYCPAGGKYALDAMKEMSCSAHGKPTSPRQPRELADATSTAQWLGRLDEMDFSLTFTPEGLRTHVRLAPKK